MCTSFFSHKLIFKNLRAEGIFSLFLLLLKDSCFSTFLCATDYTETAKHWSADSNFMFTLPSQLKKAGAVYFRLSMTCQSTLPATLEELREVGASPQPGVKSQPV